MAIQFKSDEQRKLDKEVKKPKTKLQKAHKIFFISSIVVASILALYFIGCFASGVVIAPLAAFWLLIVIIPTAVTVGLVWSSDGFRNFVFDVANLLANAIVEMPKIAKILADSLMYVGPISLAIIATYAVLSFLNFHKDKENKKYFKHFIVSVILFAAVLIFVIVAIVMLSNAARS